MNKNIEKFIYVWDTHWSSNFLDFVEKFNDWKTFFYFLWDIFDRWLYSYENYEKIIELHQKWLWTMILWNHDLFFILSKWLMFNIWEINKTIVQKDNSVNFKKVLNYHNALFNYNWWYQTEYSFLRNFWWKWVSETEDTQKVYSEVANYMLKNFDVAMLDHNNNLLIHWWIPILPTWDLVEIEYKWKFLKWVELLLEISKWVKQLDYNAITILDQGIEDWKSDYIVSAMNRFCDTKGWDENLKYWEVRYLSPTWYDSSMYDKNEIILNTLLKELNNNNIENIFVWHWHNKEVINQKFNDVKSNYWLHRRVFRLDRSHIQNAKWEYWSIWYAIFDKNNILIETWTYKKEL